MKETKDVNYRFIYTDIYIDKVVELYHKGMKKKDIIKKYEVSSYLLNKWIKQYNYN